MAAPKPEPARRRPASRSPTGRRARSARSMSRRRARMIGDWSDWRGARLPRRRRHLARLWRRVPGGFARRVRQRGGGGASGARSVPQPVHRRPARLDHQRRSGGHDPARPRADPQPLGPYHRAAPSVRRAGGERGATGWVRTCCPTASTSTCCFRARVGATFRWRRSFLGEREETRYSGIDLCRSHEITIDAAGDLDHGTLALHLENRRCSLRCVPTRRCRRCGSISIPTRRRGRRPRMKDAMMRGGGRRRAARRRSDRARAVRPHGGAARQAGGDVPAVRHDVQPGRDPARIAGRRRGARA